MTRNEIRRSLSPSGRAFAFVAMIVLVLAAVLLAQFFVRLELFSLRPPATETSPDPAFDVEPGQAFRLYQTVFTAWAALVLLIPALACFWFRDQSRRAANVWLSFWTVSCIAFWIHLFWAIVLFFQADLDAIANSSRITAFWPGMIVAIWWAGDVVLSWTRVEDRGLVKIQRTLVHLFVGMFYFVGSAIEGEILVSKALGVILAVAVAGSLVRRYLLK